MMLDQLLRKIGSYPELEQSFGRYLMAFELGVIPAHEVKAATTGQIIGEWYSPSDSLDNPSMFWASTDYRICIDALIERFKDIEVYDRAENCFLTFSSRDI